LKGIDDSWIRPINDVVNASSCIGCLNIQTISQSAEMFADLAMKLQGLKAPEHRHFELPHATEGFRSTTGLRQERTSLVAAGNGELYQYAYYLPDDIYDARYDPAFSPIYYPGDTVSYDVQGTSACIFIQDCQGNRYCSDEFDVRRRKMISWQLPEGCNLTINRIGLMHEGELCLYDMDESRHAVLDIDFHGYPVDRLGPRYGGDYMENIRGFVPHSGRWQLTEKGLQGSSEEHALITTGHLENEIEELEMVAETYDVCSFGLIWGFHGFRRHNRLIVENNTLKVMRISGEKKETIISAPITLQKGKNSLKVRYCFDNIIVYFNSVSFVVQKSSELTAVGAIGSVIEGPGKVLITGFKLRSSI
ncbi:MAG: hypothetical protein IJI05_03955, partial [Erysipelotrichaceae bacterium]|nr:hypothetical protein [Erysipelotrichaceae bacterium]